MLLVDDFRNFIITMRNMLASLGFVIIDTANDGEEAVSRIMSRRYDIVLCDYNLGPGKDGQQVLEEVKQRQLLSPLTIFMMVTAENSLEMVMGAAEYQPDEYLIKPFTKQVLEKKIRRLMEKKESIRRIEKKMEAMEYQEALEICEELIGQHPHHLADLLKIKGDLLIKNGSYEEAQRFFHEISLLGKFPWALLGQGRINYLQERYEAAEKIYRELIRANDKSM
ncbi:MAG: response regulator, partial [Syntrophobacterales bacterium]|nr:response regulator [Syntrophobacterales bacterium]